MILRGSCSVESFLGTDGSHAVLPTLKCWQSVPKFSSPDLLGLKWQQINGTTEITFNTFCALQ